MRSLGISRAPRRRDASEADGSGAATTDGRCESERRGVAGRERAQMGRGRVRAWAATTSMPFGSASLSASGLAAKEAAVGKSRPKKGT